MILSILFGWQTEYVTHHLPSIVTTSFSKLAPNDFSHSPENCDSKCFTKRPQVLGISDINTTNIFTQNFDNFFPEIPCL